MSVTISRILEKLVARYLKKNMLLLAMAMIMVRPPVKVKVLWVMWMDIWGAVRFTEAPWLPRKDLPAVSNRNGNLWTIVGISLYHLSVRHNAHPFFNLTKKWQLKREALSRDDTYLAEDHMFPIEVGTIHRCDEKLGPICVRTRVCHGQLKE